MQNVLIFNFIIVLYIFKSNATYRNKNFIRRFKPDSQFLPYLYITNSHTIANSHSISNFQTISNSHTISNFQNIPTFNNISSVKIDKFDILRGVKNVKFGVRTFTVLTALNPENAELHPAVLSPVESKLTPEELENLKKKGLIDGNTNTWRNWHIISKGEWPDIGPRVLPGMEKNLKITEPYALRKPLKYWGFMRGIESNVLSYPILYEYYKDMGNIPVHEHGGNNPLFNPLLFQPTYTMEKDRCGLFYDDARLFEGWINANHDTPTKVKEASDLIRIPDTGRLYQKFYMGPYPVTMGWTIGSLLKVMTQSRCPGHAVVAVKIHNMNKDTTVNGVADDLLNIALNLKMVSLQTLEYGKEARVRTVIKGPAMLCAGALEWPSFVKLCNPECYITKLEEGAELDLEIKIEWGRGFWMADSKGLYRLEEGANSLCHKRRDIKEVKEEGFYPTSCVFGGCRMIRLAVHKLMGQRWCSLTYTCPDPMDQLVVEIWTDVSTTPKHVLEFGLSEVIAWLTEFKRQVSHDVDFEHEDEQLKDIWEKIDKYGSMKHRQELMGGPPVVPLHETDAIPNLRQEDCQYVNPGDHTKIPQANFSLPNSGPHSPELDSLQWLAEELQAEEYNEKSEINAKNFEKFIPKPVEDTFENKDIDLLPVNSDIISSLRMSGFNVMADLMDYSVEELSHFPNLSIESAKIIKNFLTEHKSSS
ncbi:RNA polymerase Rpb3/RpoA insert domain protein [Theileria parva strain Muguga]|uniref:RNA polymerase Rpb3/RpoA insert domain protein n=1 Tax=Theileria parva strain Muguga TaxID=333668 RepID=UPI001C619252|nr:RNA polymerase Rpb3/RpoA insert domain protein [Theileria parva strain Muguga]EAN33370.2 RNA polymerase Rpb3/RpoA insert domain protein [Theileria parva strain Muguga]